MQIVFKKQLWKDIFIMVILVGIAVLRYNSYKKLDWFLIPFIILSTFTVIYAVFYSLYNCKNNKERKWLAIIYATPIVFSYLGDVLDVLIYLIIAAIFLENREKFLKYYFITTVTIIVITMISYFFGIVPNFDRYRGDLLRRSLGWSHPNTIFRFFFGTLIALYIMDKNKMMFTIYGLSMTIPLYLLTNSRTGLVCSVLFIILGNMGVVFEKYINKLSCKYFYLLMSVFSIAFVLVFHDSNMFNEWLSGRPGILHNLLVDAKWHLIYGYREFRYCDNRIFYLLVRDGLLALIVTNIFYYFVFRKEVSFEIKIVFVMSLIYGLTENFRGIGQTIVPLLCLWNLYDNYFKNKKDIISEQNIQNLSNNDNK